MAECGNHRPRLRGDFGDDQVRDVPLGQAQLVRRKVVADEAAIRVTGSTTGLTAPAASSVTPVVDLAGTLTLAGYHPDLLFLG